METVSQFNSTISACHTGHHQLSMKCILLLILFAGTIATGCIAADPHTGISADLILHNGKIVTVNPSFDIEEAIAIRGENILAVGKDETIQALADPDTRMVNLKGKTVIPGLIDGHYHFMNKAVSFHRGVDVALVESIDEMVKRIKKKVEQTPAGELVYTTSGWLPQQFKEKRVPTRYDLDPVSPNNPVIVVGGHSLYLNSYALRQAGISKDTVSPEGGAIAMDPGTGKPTGRLIENAKRLAKQEWTIGVATHKQKLEAIKASQKKLNAAGITSIREPGISAADMRVFQELHDNDELSVRVSMNYSLDPAKTAEQLIKQLETWGVSTGFGDHKLRIDGIGEFGIDGGFEGALMSEPYMHAPGNENPKEYFGLQRIPTKKFEQVLQAMSRLGWRASIHIAGDRGLDIALDAYQKASQLKPIAPKRWVIEHAHYTRPDQFKRINDLGLVISTQFHPYMAAQNMTYFWGEERSSKAMRMRDWLDAGLIVGGGSDWSLLPANPFWMIYFWVTRDTRLGGVIGYDQRISREEALRVMTINNAYITFEENIKGSLEPGKLADLLVLSDDVLTVANDKIKEITPLLTLLGGKVVHQTSGAITVH
ncbi:MAG: putative amidohydrolase YtcJ [Planctomycetota bacterium]|jgi:predicted amidohydrolase YtcJ